MENMKMTMKMAKIVNMEVVLILVVDLLVLRVNRALEWKDRKLVKVVLTMIQKKKTQKMKMEMTLNK